MSRNRDASASKKPRLAKDLDDTDSNDDLMADLIGDLMSLKKATPKKSSKKAKEPSPSPPASSSSSIRPSPRKRGSNTIVDLELPKSSPVNKRAKKATNGAATGAISNQIETHESNVVDDNFAEHIKSFISTKTQFKKQSKHPITPSQEQEAMWKDEYIPKVVTADLVVVKQDSQQEMKKSQSGGVNYKKFARKGTKGTG